jgi:hypothetical protein
MRVQKLAVRSGSIYSHVYGGMSQRRLALRLDRTAGCRLVWVFAAPGSIP